MEGEDSEAERRFAGREAQGTHLPAEGAWRAPAPGARNGGRGAAGPGSHGASAARRPMALTCLPAPAKGLPGRGALAPTVPKMYTPKDQGPRVHSQRRGRGSSCARVRPAALRTRARTGRTRGGQRLSLAQDAAKPKEGRPRPGRANGREALGAHLPARATKARTPGRANSARNATDESIDGRGKGALAGGRPTALTCPRTTHSRLPARGAWPSPCPQRARR